MGAGAMGLAAAYEACKQGYQVQVFEAGDKIGGMAAHFDFGGLSLERYYHFICKSDTPTFELLDELGIADTLRWVDTKMGYYINGTTYPWGDPISLLKFPLLNMWQKFRYGLTALRLTRKADFRYLEDVSATDWIRQDFGEKTYALLWKRLLELKFFEYTDTISAAWIATRIKRIGKSRKSLMQEQLGYLHGGSETLISALAAAIEAKGGQIHIARPVKRINIRQGRVTGVKLSDGTDRTFDALISTVPTPLVAAMVPDLSAAEKAAYGGIANIGVVCVAVKLARSITPNFWLNINDPRIDVPGIIEFSNLRPMDHPVVYVPYYMPVSHPKFSQCDAAFEEEITAYLRILQPLLTVEDVLDMQISRLRYSQPVCEPGFAKKIPPIKPAISGLQIADTCYYYPEDRGLAESIRLGRRMAQTIV